MRENYNELSKSKPQKVAEICRTIKHYFSFGLIYNNEKLIRNKTWFFEFQTLKLHSCCNPCNKKT